ncbi:MAG: DUF4365 domain-containing protein [bacterium]|nr:DUF4365 domain-containing protein [bacterium]
MNKTNQTEGDSTPMAVLERKIKGHTGWVMSVAVSPDGKWAVSGSDDKTIKTWDLESGQCRATLEGHEDSVRFVAITPDGARILSASADKTLRLWDAGTGRHLVTCEGHTIAIWSAAILPDGGRALSGSFDNTLKLWDLESGKCLKTTKGHIGGVICVAVAKDGKHAISGETNGTLKHWYLETGFCLATLTGHSDDVNSVQITVDGRRAVSGSDDKTVKVWDLEAGTCVGTFEGHQNKIYSVAISPDGTLVASTGFQESIRLWNLKSGACLQEIKGGDKYFGVMSVTFSPDGSRLVVGDIKGNLYIYHLTGVKAAPPVEAGERYTNARVVLVGESGVGKSGLAHRLIEDKFVQTYSTHGMNVQRLDLPIKEEKGIQKEALLWDLAGQEDYRLIHQLFLDNTSLALVLFNPQKEDPFAEVVDWVKVLDAAAKSEKHRPPRLLVAARTDVGGVKVSRKKIDRFLEENNFAGYLPTSAMQGDNCSDSMNNRQPSQLKQLITRHIPWSTLPWTSAPRLLRELKNAVVAMKEENAGLLRFDELVRQLKQKLPGQTFFESDVRTAVTLLGNHCLVLPLTFGDLVLLAPELLNGYASAVIRAARAHMDEIGCVAEKDVFERLIDFAGVDRLPEADEVLLMRAMVQTFLDKSLCIAEETPEGKQLIFPSQYRRERPLPRHPEIFVSYTFTGEPATVYTTLVVRLWYSREFDNKELWRNAAEFKTISEQTAGLVLERTREGEATICVFFDPAFSEDLKVVFIEYVHRHLYHYAQQVSRDRRYICQCGKPVTDLETVRERLAQEKTFIYCQKCDRKVQLIDHIEKRLGTDRVAQKVLQMDQTAAHELDTQALEQILIGHMMAICGEAKQIFRPVSMFDYGIDGEVEFKDKKGKPTGQKIYVQLKSGDSYLRQRKRDDTLVFDVKNARHLEYWQTQPVDVYLVIRDTGGRFGSEETIRWMNVTHYLKTRQNKKSKQIVFNGEKLDAAAIKRIRDAPR